MAIVTDKKYHLNNNLKELIDLFIERKNKGWDNLLIIDGKERSGKTTLAKAICYYYAYETGKQFNLNQAFFDPEKLEQFAKKNKGEVILWDEAAFGGLATQWQNKVQLRLNMLLMTAGKYNHFYVFIIPSFFRLQRYLAIDRSIGLIHVYSEDLVSRGPFACYNEAQKTWIYNSYKKSETYGKNYSFLGRFVKKNIENAIWNEEEYEAKKDNAIDNIKKYFEVKKDKSKEQLIWLQNELVKHLSVKEVMNITKVTRKTVYNWRNRGAIKAKE